MNIYTILGSAIGSAIVAILTLQNFFKQKWWERKERVYSETIEKLQEIQIFLFECQIDLNNIDKFNFDHESIRLKNHLDMHHKLVELLLINDKFAFYTYKLSPYFFAPSLKEIKEISDSLRNGYLSSEIETFALLMKSDLKIDMKYYVCRWLLLMEYVWRRIQNR